MGKSAPTHERWRNGPPPGWDTDEAHAERQKIIADARQLSYDISRSEYRIHEERQWPLWPMILFVIGMLWLIFVF